MWCGVHCRGLYVIANAILDVCWLAVKSFNFSLVNMGRTVWLVGGVQKTAK